MRLRRALRERLLEVHHGRQLVVVDLDHVGRIGRLCLGLGEHHGHDLALVPDLLLGDGEALGYEFLLSHESGRGRMRAGELALEVARGVDADDAGRLAGVGDVDALDAGVRNGAARERGVRGALADEVVDVVAVAGDEPRVFAAMDLGSDELGDRHLSCPPPRPGSSGPASRSSSWLRSGRP